MKWIIEQTWRHIFFIHIEVDKDLLQNYCPFPIDTFEDKAYVSIVPFQMDSIRFPYTFPIPGVSSLWELNLRTYVEVDGVKGVYFFTLDTDNLFAEFIANKFFHLPYRYSSMRANVKDSTYIFEHSRGDLNLKLLAKIGDELHKTQKDLFLTERYHLFTHNKDKVYRGDVFHSPWPLKEIKLEHYHDGFSKQLNGETLGGIDSMAYCEELKVRFKPFKRIDQS
jgi:uncharacterized protein YqjF (DUF2071 family)